WAFWWFAYTQVTTDYLVCAGVPKDRITTVQNAIDTQELRRQVTQFSDAEVTQARARLNISPSDRIGIFCGALHSAKLLPFLIESARLIRRTIPRFQLIVVGAGPEQAYIANEAKQSPWLHAVGPSFGVDKALMLRLAEIALQPGRVGLGILDCF